MARRRIADLGLCALAAASLASCGPNQQASGTAGVASAVRGYVAALDAHAGERVCRAFAPGALTALRLPKRAPSCAASVADSLGYRDPRGYPVWRHTTIEHVRSIVRHGSLARATVTMRTTFADNREPSVEDDVVYLTRRGGSWLVAQPSAVIYRAIGVGTPPLSALRPPPGWPGG